MGYESEEKRDSVTKPLGHSPMLSDLGD